MARGLKFKSSTEAISSAPPPTSDRDKTFFTVSQMIFNATRRKPYFIGKPEPAIAQLAMAKEGVGPEATVLVGDRIYTDIACGVNAGITTVLVFSGETTREDWEKSEIKPTFTCQSIADIWEAIR